MKYEIGQTVIVAMLDTQFDGLRGIVVGRSPGSEPHRRPIYKVDVGKMSRGGYLVAWEHELLPGIPDDATDDSLDCERRESATVLGYRARRSLDRTTSCFDFELCGLLPVTNEMDGGE